MADMKKEKANELFLAVILISQILFLMFLTWRFGVQRLDGDDTAEMVLANLLSREGGILSHNWFYSTEIRVLNNQIIMSLLFRLFHSWHLVRTLGTGILVTILLTSYLFLCSRIPEGQHLRKWAPVVLLPFSYVYLDIVLYGLYYIPHISILFFSLGLLLEKKENHGRIRIVVLLLLAFIAGLGGIRIPAVVYTPMFLAAFFLYLSGRDKKTLMLSFAACVTTGVGFLINILVLSRRYTFMTHSNLRLTTPNLYRAKEVVLNTIQVCGGGRPALSVYGIGAIFGLLLFAGIVSMFAVIVKKRREVSPQLQIMILTFVFSWLISAFSAVFTNSGWANRYAMIPCMGMIPVLAESVALCKEKVRRILSAILAGLLLICSTSQVYYFASTDKLKAVRPAYSYILDSGLTFGYSTWEVGDVLTEISDGRIHMCKVQNFANLWRWNWLMEKDYMKYAEDGPVFVLLDKERFDYTDHSVGHFWGEWTKDDLVWTEKAAVGFEDDKYVVWVFSSENEFEKLTGSRPHE